MRERPILFSGPMVRAIMAGRKTQTRRVVKFDGRQTGTPCSFDEWALPAGRESLPRQGYQCFRSDGPGSSHFAMPCPYGEPGDRLVVRESFRCGREWDDTRPSDLDPLCGASQVRYEADGMAYDLSPSGPGEPWRCDVEDGWGKLRPGIFMPRWACRLTLDNVSSRVERLQAISDADIHAEGAIVEGVPGFYESAFGGTYPTPISLWATGWDSLNDKRPGCAWEDDPLVWVVEFRRVEATHA